MLTLADFSQEFSRYHHYPGTPCMWGLPNRKADSSDYWGKYNPIDIKKLVENYDTLSLNKQNK